jgi:hypothetical protein
MDVPNVQSRRCQSLTMECRGSLAAPAQHFKSCHPERVFARRISTLKSRREPAANRPQTNLPTNNRGSGNRLTGALATSLHLQIAFPLLSLGKL